jgi:hypothetical protein
VECYGIRRCVSTSCLQGGSGLVRVNLGSQIDGI